MNGRLPSRRFRDVQILVGVALGVLVAVSVVELQGILTLVNALRSDARTTARMAAELLTLPEGGADWEGAEPPHPGVSWAVIEGGRVVRRVGAAGPQEPPWWPWASAEEFARAGSSVRGPLRFLGGQVLVVRAPLPGDRVLRVVVQVPSSVLAARWQWYGGVLGLVVAAGGGLLAWFLVGRLLSPYQELLSEAGRVGRPEAGQPEDRFLIETFRETIQRLQDSEATLRQRADELEVLADILTREASSGVVVTDGQGRVRAANETASVLLGTSLEPGGAVPDAVVSGMGRITLMGRSLEIGRFPLRSEGGSLLGEVVFVGDRTRLEALERALQEREHMATLGELAAGMTHEVRNALATIRGFLWLLPDAEAAERQRYLEAVAAESSLVEEVLERFLTFAQPQTLRRESVALGDLVREVARRLAGTAPEVAIHVHAEAVEISGDALALGVVVENLLRNALEAAPGVGGEVRVTVEGTTGAARVVVEDNGAGVSDEVAGRLFQPFATTKASGGLGLALARRFARLHGGDVVYVPLPGAGARFEVLLPLEDRP